MSDTTEDRRPRVSPYCTYLSSKKLCVSARPALRDEDVLDASNHCWCGRTSTLLGPDGHSAHPEDCRSDRECFESPVRGLL